MLRLFDQWVAALATVGHSDGTAAEVLTDLGRNMLSIILSPVSIALHRILFAEASRLPDLCERMYGAKTEAIERHDPIRVVLRRLVARGALRGDDVGFLDYQFIQMIIARPLRHALLGAPPMTAAVQEEHVRKTVDLFLRGAATTTSPKSR